MKDPYAVLGVSKTATPEQIKKAYRDIAKTSHPDLHPDDTKAELRFKAAAAAYDLLRDPDTRARFDRGEIDADGVERRQRSFYRDYAEAPDNPYRTGPRFDRSAASDFFADFLRQQTRSRHGPGAQGFAAPGADLRFALEVPFLDAVNGGSAKIVMPDGGKLEMKIPRGTEDGQTVRLRGKGEAGISGGPAGDALVTIAVRPHPQFRRDGNDIHLTLPITLYEAVLGAKVEVPTIDGKVSVTVPKGASGGQVLRLRGRGVEPQSGPRGDQLVVLRLVSPPKIDPQLAALMETWRHDHGYDPRKEAPS